MSKYPGALREFESNHRRTVHVGILILVCGLSAGIFLLTSANFSTFGFPLDDAWIHQTYARNLLLYKDWVYIPGQVSAGSTSPLWTLLIAVGYVFTKNVPYCWTFLLGTGALFGLAYAGEWIYAKLSGDNTRVIPWVGIFLATEWHLVWGAVSGMETILFAAVIAAVFTVLVARSPRWIAVGAIIGLSCWLRPDGITLLGPALFLAVCLSREWKTRIRAAATCLAGFGLIFTGYLLLNYRLAGAIWPNTFYAKQAEYAVQLGQPLLERLGSLISLPLIGAGSVLIPGFLFAIWKAIQSRDWKILALAIWWAGYTVMYAVRLPVVYQHGRYLIPSMPVFFLIGLIGSIQIIQTKFAVNKPVWFLGKIIFVSIIVVQLLFGYKGAVAYSQDVAIINSEMVATAAWIAGNTPSNAIIAAHDIGAIGYFSQRKILDLAGLVSPEVIPFIRDEARLADYLSRNQADYLVTFPGWYPALVSRASLVFQIASPLTLQSGGENMAVFIWPK